MPTPGAPEPTALTTGASSGIGLATVLDLARRGLRSVGSVRSDAKAAAVRQAAAEVGVGDRVDTVLLDVTDAPACAEVVARVRPAVLVNNAGYSAIGAVEDVDDDEARRALETMVVAPMRLARLALTPMRAAGHGRIMNVSSVYGRATTPLTGWYQAAKHALEALSDALRTEVARDGIAVVVVEPGGFRTRIWDRAEAEVDGRAASRYQTGYRRTLSATRAWQPFMGDPRWCASVIGHAATTRWPRARYLVGADAWALTALDRFTPTRVKDEVVRRLLGM